PHAGHPFLERFWSNHQQVIEPRPEAMQKFRIEPAGKIDVRHHTLPAGGRDTLLSKSPFSGTFLTGQQTQPADRPSADPRQRIDLREAGGPPGTGRSRGPRRGAPKTGLENRDGLFESIRHLNHVPQEISESTPMKGPPRGRRTRR